MAWDAHQVVRRPWALFESNGFHPYPHSLVFSDHLLPEALMVAPLWWATGNAVLGLNVSTLLALFLSATGMYLLVRAVTASSAAGVAAGVVYAFNSFTLHELPRVHVLHVQWWPLALLFLLRFAESGRWRHALLAAAALAVQALSGTYYLAYTLLLLPVWLLVLAFFSPRRRGLPGALRLAAALALAFAPVAVVVAPYLVHLRAFGFEKSWSGGADLLAYLAPDRRNWLWGAVLPSGARAELSHFLGVAGVALMVAGAALLPTRRVRPAARAAGVVALASALLGLALSLGPIVHAGGKRLGPGPYALLWEWVPAARAMASPERAGVLVPFGQAILAGLGVAALSSALAPAGRAALAAAVALLLPLEHWQPPRPGAVVPAGGEVPAVYAWLREESRAPLVELPLFPERARRLFAAYLYFSTYHWRPVPLGRASFYPPAHDWLAWNLRGFPDEVSLAMLERLGIRRVVVHPLAWEAGERAGRLALLDASPRLRLVRRFEDVVPARFSVLGLGEERAYQLLPAPLPAPPCAPAAPLAREGWAFASSGVNKPERVRDGDGRTAWFTARPQRPGDRLEAEWPAAQAVAAVGVGIGYPHEEFVRNPVVVLQDEVGAWRRAEVVDDVAGRLGVLDDLLRRPAAAEVVLRVADPRPARGVRVAVGFREEDPAWPRWSVNELRVYGDCRPAVE
jgi:hypothetical protein